MLEAIRDDILACRHCAERFAQTRTAHEPRPVLRASSTARICIIGQAPGARVHESGVPFLDRSGDRLRSWMGVDDAIFYDVARIAIIPMAFCFPGYDARGSDLPPPKDCASLWRERLFATLPSFELTLLIGQYAQAWHLGAARKRSLTETAAAWREYTPAGRIPLPHPSWRNTGWLRKNPWFETETVPWLRSAVSRLL